MTESESGTSRMRNSIAILFPLLLMALVGCGEYRGIPTHGGGKRFDEEQRVVASAIRHSVSDMNLVELKGRRVQLTVDGMANDGGGNVYFPGVNSINGGFSGGLGTGNLVQIDLPTIGYVVKRYPRYSETFVVNEVLAHEAAGASIEIFALHSGNDSHFQDAISRVRAPVTYLSAESVKSVDFWERMRRMCNEHSIPWRALEAAQFDEWRDVYQALMLAQHVKARNIGHLHAHFATSAASVARLAALFCGISFSITAHAKDIFHESVKDEDLLRKTSDADAVITVSDYNLSFLRERFPHQREKFTRIYNGLDLSQLSFGPQRQSRRVVLGIGRLVEKKGFDQLIHASAILKQRGVDFHCQIIGEGEEEPSLRALIRSLDVASHVTLVGPRPQREVFAALRQAAIFAAPCLVGGDGNRDGLPTVLLEAMALGTPCISTDVTGIPEVIQNGETGCVVPQRNPQALADACQELLSQPLLADQLAWRGRQRIESAFDIAANSRAMRELLGTVIAKRRQIREIA